MTLQLVHMQPRRAHQCINVDATTWRLHDNGRYPMVYSLCQLITITHRSWILDIVLHCFGRVPLSDVLLITLREACIKRLVWLVVHHHWVTSSAPYGPQWPRDFVLLDTTINFKLRPNTPHAASRHGQQCYACRHRNACGN